MLSDEEKRSIDYQATNYGILWKYGDELCRIYPPKVACVYALKMANNTVKIGISQDVLERKMAIQGASGIEIVDFYYTGFAPREFMLKIEKRCHATFKDFRTKGEYFNITFEAACAELDKYADEIADALKNADCKFLEEVDYYNELEEHYLNKPKEQPNFPIEQEAQTVEQTAQTPQNYSNDNPPPFWQLLKIIRNRLIIKIAEKLLGEKLF